MDTTGPFPTLGNNDPLYQIADYTQQMATAVDKLPKGLLWFNNVSSPTGNISAKTVVNNLSTFTFKAGRNYKITWEGSLAGSANGQYNIFAINSAPVADSAGSTANLTSMEDRTFRLSVSGYGESFRVAAYVKSSLSEVTTQLKFTAENAAGGGSFNLSKQKFSIEDLGALS